MNPTGIKHVAMRTLMSVATGYTLVSSALYGAPITFIYPAQVTPGYTISSAGLYVLADDATYSTAGGTAITIAASVNNVTLDLAGRRLIGSSSAFRGINFAGTSSNVVIKNGTITGFDTNGVKISSATAGTSYKNIELRDLTVNGNGGTGIEIIDARNVLISNCTSGSNAFGAFLISCTQVRIQDSIFSRNKAATCAGLTFTGCDVVEMKRCCACNNESTANDVFGLNMASCRAWNIRDCSFDDNLCTSPATAITWGGLVTSCTAINFENCTFNRNINNRGNAGGAAVTLGAVLDSSSACVLKNCSFNGMQAFGNSSSGVEGLRVVTGGSNSFNGCQAVGNDGVGSAIGFSIRSGRNIFENCSANGNSSAGTSIGFNIPAASANSLNQLRRCLSVGQIDGFADGNGAGANIFIGCMASRNTSANFSVGIIPFNVVDANAAPTIHASYAGLIGDEVANYSFIP